MAMLASKIILGCDVSQHWLDLNHYGATEVQRVDNSTRAIDRALKPYAGAAIAIEATNTYHELIVERALKLGLEVYLISGYQLRRYAESIGQRMRTDIIDARLLARYLDREINDLTPYEPPHPMVRGLWRLMKRRALLTQQKTQISQSLTTIPELKASARSLVRRLNEVIAVIDRRMRVLARQLGWLADLKRLRTLPGVGPLTAMALLIAYRRHEFSHRDPYVAFMGLDVKTKDSGKHRGKRKLTKQGDPEYRRLLYCAAMAARRSDVFKPIYEDAIARGFASTGALVIIARKLARLAFGLLKNQVEFDPQYIRRACPQT